MNPGQQHYIDNVLESVGTYRDLKPLLFMRYDHDRYRSTFVVNPNPDHSWNKDTNGIVTRPNPNHDLSFRFIWATFMGSDTIVNVTHLANDNAVDINILYAERFHPAVHIAKLIECPDKIELGRLTLEYVGDVLDRLYPNALNN
ncbi:hypothetical protein D3C85_1045570 [compost metagenome]